MIWLRMIIKTFKMWWLQENPQALPSQMMAKAQSCPRHCQLGRSRAKAWRGTAPGSCQSQWMTLFLCLSLGPLSLALSLGTTEQSLALSPLSLLQAEQSQLHQPFPMWQMLQARECNCSNSFPNFQYITDSITWNYLTIQKDSQTLWLSPTELIYLSYSSSSVSKMAIFNWMSRKYY